MSKHQPGYPFTDGNGDAISIPGAVVRAARRGWPIIAVVVSIAASVAVWIYARGTSAWAVESERLHATDAALDRHDQAQDRRLDSHEAEIRQHYTEIVQRLSRIEGKLDGKAMSDRPRVAESGR